MSRKNKRKHNGNGHGNKDSHGSGHNAGRGNTSTFSFHSDHPAGAPPRPVLLLEINEVPWRVIDRFAGEYLNIRRFFGGAQTFTSMTVDSGELSPWITWPSFHRGLSDREHKVQFLGQDPATYQGTPIWEEFRNRGHSIGVFGSLQSWPPMNPGPGGFYVPDTFAHDERCIPRYVEPFQKFNLGQVARNARVIDKTSLFTRELVPLVASLPKLGVKPVTAARVAKQLVEERLDPVKVSRRPVFQSILCWDVFKTLFDPEHPPAFSTFFTNHVAGVMHRYWDNVFPEDFDNASLAKATPYLDTMRFALEFTDRMLGDVFAMQARNPELVVVWASSMGQDTIHRDNVGAELVVKDLTSLMSACGLEAREFRHLLAMVPQIAAEVPDPGRRAHARRTLEAARTSSGAKLFRVDETSTSLSITVINPSRADIDAGRCTINGRVHEWRAAGIDPVETEPGTAYHIPEGTLAVHGRGIEPSDARTRISARDCKQLLLDVSGLEGVAAEPRAKVAK